MGEVLTTAVQQRVEAFADDTTARFEGSHAPLSTALLTSTSSPTHQAHTPPPLALSLSNIKASGTPVRFSSLMLIVNTNSKNHDHSSDNVSDDQHDKRVYIRIKIEPIDDDSHGSNVSSGSAPQVSGHDTIPIKGGGGLKSLINIGDAESDMQYHSQTWQL